MGYEKWWEMNNSESRSIPPNPKFDFEISNLNQIGSTLFLEGVLVNSSIELLEIPIFPSPSIFVITIDETSTIKYNPNRHSAPYVPPAPHVLIIPPHSRLEFKTSLNLLDYVYNENSVIEVLWHFMTWHEPRKHGKLVFELE